jgi:hypothetical protein
MGLILKRIILSLIRMRTGRDQEENISSFNKLAV